MPRSTASLPKLFLSGVASLNLILVDRYLLRAGNPFLGIPRSIPELFSPPDRVFRLLSEHGHIPHGARFVSCEHLGGSDTEPDKNVARLSIVYSLPGSGTVERKIFIKIPTARQWSAVAKAAIATIFPDAKEVAFYNDVFPALSRQAGGPDELGFRVPQNLFATWSRPFDRSIIIQECVDMDRFHSRPDWMDADASVVQRIVDSAADLHRRTWQLRGVPPDVIAKYRERGGVDWLDIGLRGLLLAAPASFRHMWEAIKKRAAREPVTISHGDCRLGNCLFDAEYAEIILTDWEVTSITYYMWDISYAMMCSFSPEDRRKNEEHIVRGYLEALAEHDDVPTFESAMEMHRISGIVVSYFGGLIAAFGGVGETQGNSKADMDSWAEKCEAAMLDALADEVALARSLDIEVSLVRRFREDYLTYSRRAADFAEEPGVLPYLRRQARSLIAHGHR
jgi:hypothetical protein